MMAPQAFGLDPADGNVLTVSNAYGTRYFSRVTGQSLRLWNSGAVEYLSGRDFQGAVGFDESQAYGLCQAFIEEHGGMPTDARLDEVYVQKRRQMSLEDGSQVRPEETLGYTFCFARKRYGLPVEGDDRILLAVGPSGVDQYVRLWRRVVGPSAERQQVMAAESAVERVFGKVAGASPLARARLAYYSAPAPVSQELSMPVWVVEKKDGGRVLVNAHSGEFVQGFAAWPEALAGLPQTPGMTQNDPDDFRN